MLYRKEPEAFNPNFHSVGCFMEYSNQILLLLRQDYRQQGNTWGIPSGKVECRESPIGAVVREIKEETGFTIYPKGIAYISCVYVRFPDYDFIYHIFHTKLDEMCKVRINPEEHKDFRWVSPNEALAMNLIQDLDACIEMVYGAKHI